MARSMLLRRRGDPTVVWLLALRMMLDEKLKTAGTLFGVIFATLLVNQNVGILLGLVHQMTVVVRQSEADIWVTPPFTETFEFAGTMPLRRLYEVAAVPGVLWAEPVFKTQGMLRKTRGDLEPVLIIGSQPPRYAAGPRHLRQGSRLEELTQRDAIFIDWSDRGSFGDYAPGDVREVNGLRARLAGYTEQLRGFGSILVMTSLRQAQAFARVPDDTISFVLVKVGPGFEPETVRRAISRRVAAVDVFSRERFIAGTVDFWFRRTKLGVNMAISTGFGILVGFVIVSLTMLTTVVDRARDFSTLRAIGAHRGHLIRLMVAQSLIFACGGYLVGVGMFLLFKHFAVKEGGVSIVAPGWMYAMSLGMTVTICLLSSLIALRRVFKAEPGMVFRG